MIFIIFFAYFFITASIVAFEGGFDETIIQKGYPTDFETASEWNKEEWMVWVLSWLPYKMIIKLKNHCNLDLDDTEKEWER